MGIDVKADISMLLTIFLLSLLVGLQLPHSLFLSALTDPVRTDIVPVISNPLTALVTALVRAVVVLVSAGNLLFSDWASEVTDAWHMCVSQHCPA